MSDFDNNNATQDNKQEKTHKNGFPWTTKGPFNDFEEAQAARIKFEKENKKFDAKIRFLSDGFFLKTRKKMSFLLEEEQLQAEAEKNKKEKMTLNSKEKR